MLKETVGSHSGSVTDEIEVEVFRDGDSVLEDIVHRQKLNLYYHDFDDSGMLTVRLSKHYLNRVETVDTLIVNTPEAREALQWVSEALRKHNMTEV